MKKYSIAIAIVKNKDRYLIGKRAESKKFAPNQWEFISGFIDEGESAQETALRELKEETGLTGKIVKAGEQFNLTDEEGEWNITPFVIQTDTNYKLNKTDHSELKWVSKDELLEYEDLRDITENLIALKLL